MPARPKTTDAEIVHAACVLVESKGRDGFSMKDVAAVVGIRAPSLYGRFRDRAALLTAVELQVWADLAELLGKSVIAGNPVGTLMAQSYAIRHFAAGNPNSYSLFFDIRSEPTEEGNTARSVAVSQMLAPLAELVGNTRAFAAARVLVPYLHGFISMELANGFRLADGVDTAFENGLAVILDGLIARTRFDDED